MIASPKTLATILFLVLRCSSENNGLGMKPQMGWNSWNHFGCDVNQTVVIETAQALKEKGLLEKGYQYVNIDDCWQISRNSEGVIQPDSTTFPDWQAMIDMIHDLGFKFGLYSDAGNYTCQHRPGSLGYETIDAETYASWGVDYLKYDNCYNDGISPKERFPIMSQALNNTGSRIFYAMCEWGRKDPATWAPDIANSWRTTADITDNWSSMMLNADLNNKWWEYASPGGWNDPDMLEVGNGGMTDREYQSHFSLWALMKAPLLIGCDVRHMSEATELILGNEKVIAINQDDLGIQGHRIKSERGVEYWAGPLAEQAYALFILNNGLRVRNVTINWIDFGVPNGIDVYVENLWDPSKDGVYPNSYNIENLMRHESVFLRLTEA